MAKNISVHDTDRKEEMMVDKTIVELAKDELKADLVKEAKEKLKSKMKSLHAAKQVVANLERELADLENEISDKMDAI